MANFIKARIRQPRDIYENWENKNPILLNGERVFVDFINENNEVIETKEKIGDGITPFKELPYFSLSNSSGLISSEDMTETTIIDKNQMVLIPNEITVTDIEEEAGVTYTQTFYSAKVGNDLPLSETTYLANLKAGDGWGSVVQVEATTEGEVSPVDETKFVSPSATGQRAVALGKYTIASGDNAMAINYDTQATEKKSFAINSATKATNTAAFASGHKTEAAGAYSASFGLLTKTAGSGSLACGKSTQANGEFSFSQGQGSLANGDASAALGYKNQTSKNYQTAVGRLNEPTDTAIFMVGYGTETTNSDGSITEKRRNLLTADSKGFVQIDGTLRLKDTELTEEIITKEKNLQSALTINGSNISFNNNTITSNQGGNFVGGISSSITNGTASIGYGHSIQINNNYQTAFGIYNEPVMSDVFQIGFGRTITVDGEQVIEPKNILSMNRNGTLTIQPRAQDAEAGKEATLKLGSTSLTETLLQTLLKQIKTGPKESVPELEEGQIYFGY